MGYKTIEIHLPHYEIPQSSPHYYAQINYQFRCTILLQMEFVYVVINGIEARYRLLFISITRGRYRQARRLSACNQQNLKQIIHLKL